MSNRNFATILELREFINESMKLSSEKLFSNYLNKIFPNLLQREENYSNQKFKRFTLEQKSLFFLKKDKSLNGALSDKLISDDFSISLNNFLDYMDIQEFIGEKIFQVLNKSTKSKKLCKDDFIKGLNLLYYGNIKDLIIFTFNLADFNKEGKIHKANMDLLLKYIPCSTEFSQKSYIKQIHQIISTFFKTINQDELNLELYEKYIEEYAMKSEKEKQTDLINSEFIQDYENNAPFFYFISISSYIFKHLPFNPKFVENFQYQKITQSYKLGGINGDKSISNKKLLSTESKKNTKFNSTFRCNASINTSKRFSYNPNDLLIKEALPKIRRSNLFNIKKSSSQIFLKKEDLNKAISNIDLSKNKINKNKRAPSMNKHEYILAKKKDDSTYNSQLEKSFVDNNFIKKIKNRKKLSPSNRDSSTTKNSSFAFNQSVNLNKVFLTPDLLINKSKSNNLKEKFVNLKKKLPVLLPQPECSPMIGIGQYLKLKNDINYGMDEPEEFKFFDFAENDGGNSNRNSLIGRESNKSDNIYQVYETYLYIYDENDIYLNILNKYYATINEKEIYFYSTEQKNELCDIWYIYKSYISTSKELVGKNNYFTINITFENNLVKKLFFSKENICQSFSLSLKNSINNFNFYDYYDTMNDLGEGHFGKVMKCRNKKNGDYFAVKIINKTKLNHTDLNLIRQEKNFLELIKHENIISLKDFYEDKQSIYFVTEFYDGGDLLSYLEEKQKLKEKISEKNCARIIRKISQGIQYLNCFGIVHRDIKSENIMFARACNIKTLKIIDLGVCKTLPFGKKAKEPIGTNGYISPEIYLHNEYSFKIDIFSLGVILYLLVTGGELPFNDDNMDCQIIAKKTLYFKQDYPDEFFGDKSKKLTNLLDKMLEKDDKKRIDIDSLLKDKWFDIIKK